MPQYHDVRSPFVRILDKYREEALSERDKGK